MYIKSFKNDQFGTLTKITSHKTGITMFLGKEVANIWGHTNLTQAIKAAKLSGIEYKVIDFKQYPEFKVQLTNLKLVGQRSASITLLTESGMYKLALASNLEKAKPFRNWVTNEVLPSIRDKGYYSIADQTQKILIHTNKDIQKQNSKDINAKNFIENGIKSVIEYNQQNCLIHSGKTPHQLIEEAKNKGLKSKQRSSGKEVLRNINPEIACAMSFADDLVKNGFDLNTVSELSKKTIEIFNGIIELGLKPYELNK